MSMAVLGLGLGWAHILAQLALRGVPRRHRWGAYKFVDVTPPPAPLSRPGPTRPEALTAFRYPLS